MFRMLVNDRLTIGNILFELRSKASMTQAEVADLAGISEKAYANIERGNNDMRVETLCSICQALQTTPDFLLINTKKDKTDITIEWLNNELKKCSERDLSIIMQLVNACANDSE